jgi:hypothetical protein
MRKMEKIESIKRRGWKEETVQTDRKDKGRKEDDGQGVSVWDGGGGVSTRPRPLITSVCVH